MKEIFISYSTIDTQSAETVRNVLEKNGLSCWMAPRDIPGGSNYTKEIPEAIRNCKAFVLILSENAQKSHWVLKELDSAVNCGKVILPFMVEDCALNDEFNFLLTGAQRYSAYQKKAEAMEILINRLRSIIDTSAPQGGGEPAPVQKPIEPAKKEKATTACFVGAVCSACGSSDLTAMPKKVKRTGFKELATLLFVPLMGFVCWVIVFIICAFLPYSTFKWWGLFMVLAIVGGCVWGNIISKTMVRRSRIRHRIHATCYRCNTCRKAFRYDEPFEH